jgi:NitT/TauT family transport system ATP-binding protein
MNHAVVVSRVSVSIPRLGSVARVLDDITLEVAWGEILVVLGRSGCGKTTLLDTIAGMRVPTAGEVVLNSVSAASRSYVLQSDSLLPWRSTLANVRLVLELNGLNETVASERALELLTSVGLARAANKYPFELSGGMQQRAVFARALVREPSLVLLDEPFTNLDFPSRERLAAVLRAYCHDAPFRCAVMVTHSIEDALALADQIVVLAGSPARIVLHERIEATRDGHTRHALGASYVNIEEALLLDREHGTTSVDHA